jgi:hypothetical protein
VNGIGAILLTAGLTRRRPHANVCSAAMTSQGHAYARVQRALKTGNPVIALDAARELAHMTLEDALSLCLVLRSDKRRYQRAAARWLARYHAEVEAVTLTEIREVADLMAALPVHGAGPAAELGGYFERRGLHRCARRMRDIDILTDIDTSGETG